MATETSSCVQVIDSGFLFPALLITDSWIPIKLEAHIANMYSMPRDLNRSTMKSEPGRPDCVTSTGGAAAALSEARICGVAASAGLATRAAAPVAAPARNLRRFIECFASCPIWRRWLHQVEN